MVFVHGMFLHATSWGGWAGLFRAAGYEPVVPGWPGEPDTVAQARREPGRVAGIGLDDVVAHYGRILREQRARPVVVGHSAGALVAQRLLGEGLAAAAVALQPPAVRGVSSFAPETVPVGWPLLRNPANRRRALALTARQFRYSHGNALPAAESERVFREWTIPSPGRPVFELVFANLAKRSPAAVDTGNPERGPLLMVAGGRDHSAPAAAVRATVQRYRAVTDYLEFADRGHSMPVDEGWREVAEAALAWLEKSAR